MKKSILTFSIGIVVFNEEKNIIQLLDSIFQQIESYYKLKEVLVISDGSTDGTNSLLKDYKNQKVRLIIKRDNLGQTIRQNELLEGFQGDLLLILEGDTLLDSNYFNEITKPYLNQSDGLMVYGASLQLSGQNLLEKTLEKSDLLKQRLFYSWKKSNLYLCHSGKVISRDIAETLRWPKNVPEDSYLFLDCLDKGYKVLYAPKAKIFYRSPSNLKDYFKKTSRYHISKGNVETYFNRNLLRKYLHIPLGLLFKLAIIFFKESPLQFFLYITILGSSKIYTLFISDYNPSWKPALSTKSLNIIQKNEQNYRKEY